MSIVNIVEFPKYDDAKSEYGRDRPWEYEIRDVEARGAKKSEGTLRNDAASPETVLPC